MTELTGRAQAVLAAVSIFDMLRELNGGRDLHGDGTQQIRCPIHDDRTPSARIYAPEDNKPGKIWCFTCNRNFDVIDLVQAKFRYSFSMAVEWLESRFTVPPASASLSVVIAATLRRPAPMPLDASFQFVEAKLIASRSAMGQRAFSTGCLALDWTAHQLKTGKLDHTHAHAALTKILNTTKGE